MNSDGVDHRYDDADHGAKPDWSFEDLLVELDEALASGRAPEIPSDSLDGDLRERLKRGAALLEKLERVWPRHSSFSSRAAPLASAMGDALREAVSGGGIAGLKLGRFEIQRELGRGGNGVVFLAYDPKLGRPVALKVPRLEIMIHPELRRRFFQESRAAAGLDHPNVVPVYEAGEIGPICYIASAYCPGLTLAEWLRSATAPTSFAEKARLMVALADAVAHAHERGVLHRDLKPSNVMLARTSLESRDVGGDADGGLANAPPAYNSTSLTGVIPRITDFGLAKIVDTDIEGTSPGAVVGTPSYMSPEQADGKIDELTESADVYGLGAILYELLVGRPPFQGETSLETLIQVRAAEPIAPTRLRPGIPRDLATICMKCLEKDPRRRYETAAELATDLRLYLDGRPIHARPVGHVARAWRGCRRQPLVASLAAALLLLAAVSFVAIYWQWRRAEDRACDAIVQRRMAYEQRSRAEETLRLSVGSIDQFFVHARQNMLLDRPGSQAVREQLLESARKYYESFLRHNEGDPGLRLQLAHARMRIGDLRERLGRYAEARKSLEEAYDELLAYVQEHPSDPSGQLALAECEITLAQNIEHEDEHQRMLMLANSASERLQALPAESRRGESVRRLQARGYEALVVALSSTGAHEEALETCRQARELYARLANSNPSDAYYRYRVLASYLVEGNIHENLGDMQQAQQAWEAGLAVFPDPLPDSSSIRSAVATLHSNLGALLVDSPDRERAAEHFEAARKLLNWVVHSNPDAKSYLGKLAQWNLNYGVLARQFGETADARRLIERFVELYAGLSREQPTVTEYRHGLAKSKLALCYVEQREGNTERARRLLEQAFGIWRELMKEHPNVTDYAFQAAAARSVYAASFSRAGDTETALEYYPEVIEIYRGILERQPGNWRVHSALGAVLNDLAVTYRNVGTPTEGVSVCLEAIKHQRLALRAAPENRSVRRFMSNHYETLASLYRELGRASEALVALRHQRELWDGDAPMLVRVSQQCTRVGRSIRGDAERQELYDTCISEALDVLEQAVDAGFREVQFLKTDREFQTLRSNERFQALIQRIEKLIEASGG